jgi:hypothetical protein
MNISHALVSKFSVQSEIILLCLDKAAEQSVEFIYGTEYSSLV